MRQLPQASLARQTARTDVDVFFMRHCDKSRRAVLFTLSRICISWRSAIKKPRRDTDTIMSDELNAKGRAELRETRRKSRSLYWMVALFSFFVNMLMLTGPLYMLNIYDRVLSSRSFETLIALSVLVAFLYGMMGILDFVRGRVMGRVGARFQASLDRRVFAAVLKATTLHRAPR